MTAAPRVVVVNDDPGQLRLISGLLEKRGIAITGFTDPEEGLRTLQTSNGIDLVVVDLHMPVIDGWRFCRLLRSPDFPSFNETPILVVSATFSGTDVEAVTADLGANAFLPAPFAPETLYGYVDELLAGRKPRATLTTVIVDDEPMLRDSLARSFEAHGFEVQTAATGEEGRELIQEIRPDVLILDYHLPDLPGGDLLDMVNRPGDPTIAIVITGDADPSLPVEMLRRGADAYIRKPFSPNYLVDVARHSRRERSLLRVEEILETRTQELRASEARYRSLFAAIPEPVLILDREGQILEANRVAEVTLESEPGALDQAKLRDLLPGERIDEVSAELTRVWEDETGDFDTVLQTRGGTTFEAEVSARVIEYQGASALLTVSRDVTERNRSREARRQLDAKIQHQQKLESLGVLAGGVAHDFNNLLVGMLGNATLAQMDLSPGDPVWECVKQIEVAARRAAELTAQILTYSGNAKVTLKEADLTQLIRELGQLVEPAVSKKAVVRYDLDEGLPPIRCDSSQIRQVIMNLIMNGSDALEGERGIVGVRASAVDADRDDLQSALIGNDLPEGPFVVLEVTDTGVGMDEATCQKMFDPFFTTKFTGRGRGLAATLGIIRSHGGSITVKSEPGSGTTIRVMLPAVKGEVRAQPPKEPPTDKRWRGSGTVLIVDDEDAVRRVAKSTLERFGFNVLVASNGQDGVDSYKQNEAGIRAVLLDLAMPEMDGEEALAAIRAHDPRARVVLSSGYGEAELIARLKDKGAAGFLSKPYGPLELIESLRAILPCEEEDRPRVTPADVVATG